MLFSFSSVKNKYVFCMMGGAALLLSPAAAHAGFEWTLPPAQEQAAEPAVPPKAVEGPLTPELDSALPVPVESVDVAPVVPKEPVKAAEPEPLVETPVVAPIAKEKEIPVEPKVTVPEVSSSVVEGFGKEIPLALALRDIVPPTYAFAFGSGDVAGVKISWRGGKPWQQVLEAALTPAGLKYSVGEKVVMVSKSDVGTSPSVAAPAPSPAPAPISAPVSGYKARMTSPDTIIRENPVTPAAPVVEEKKQETPAPLTIAPAEAKPSVPVLDMTTKTKWEARPGSTLRQVLESWCKIAGVELNWSTPYDYPVSNAFYFEGTYNEAISSLLSSYGGESPAPKGRLYPNLPDGPSVLMIN